MNVVYRCSQHRSYHSRHGLGGSLSHAATSFVHPGILNNQAEYNLIKTKVAAKVEPWYTAYQQLPNHLSYTPQAVSTLTEATMSQFHQDGAAAYASALRWVTAGMSSIGTKPSRFSTPGPTSSRASTQMSLIPAIGSLTHHPAASFMRRRS